MNAPGRPTAVRIERVIPVPAHQIYRAWLDPDILPRWMAPGELEVARVEVEARVGGHLRIWQGNGDRGVGGFESEILELVPGRRLVFRWGFVGPERADGPVYDSLLTVTLDAAPGGGTTLTLLHERLDDLEAAMPQLAGQVGTGWEMVLDRLTGTLSGGPPARALTRAGTGPTRCSTGNMTGRPPGPPGRARRAGFTGNIPDSGNSSPRRPLEA